MSGSDAVERYAWVFSIDRQAGHTEAACGKRTGVVIAANAREAARITREYDVESIELSMGDRLRGRRDAMVWDTFTVQTMVGDLHADLRALRDECATLRTERDQLQAENARMGAEIASTRSALNGLHADNSPFTTLELVQEALHRLTCYSDAEAMRGMGHWTSEPPTEEGWYWVRRDWSEDAAWCAFFSTRLNRWRFEDADVERFFPRDGEATWSRWSVPIEAPPIP